MATRAYSLNLWRWTQFLGNLLARPVGLQKRIMIYVGLGCIALVALVGYLTFQALTASIDLALRERVRVVELIAQEVDSALYHADDHSLSPGIRSELIQGVLERLNSRETDGARDRPFHVAWVDGSGNVGAGTHLVSEETHNEHLTLLEDLVSQSKSGAVEHFSAVPQVLDHVLVYAPLREAPGGLVLEQAADMALEVPMLLRRRMLLSGFAAVIIGLGLAWVTTRQVVRPIENLVATSERIAAGDLDTPVPALGRDEVAQLAQSFEKMRRRLRATVLELTELNQHLEDRVDERTKELQQLSRERQALLRRILGAQEEERARVSRELHDEVGQFLTGMIFQISRAEADCCGSPLVRERLRELNALATRTMGEVRRIIMSLRPSLLDSMGLAAALRWYAQTFLEPQEIDVTMDIDGVNDLSDPFRLAVFRVVQEAMTNVLRHASASHIQIILEVESGMLRGEVRDDGVGFEVRPRQSAESSAVGLAGIRERLELVGGRLQIQSAPGQGTSIRFSVPLEGVAAS